MNLIIGVVGLVLCVLGLVQTWAGRHIEKRTRRYFIIFFSVLTGYVLFNLLGQITDNRFGYGWAVFFRFTLFFESFLSSVLTVLLTGFLLYQSGERKWRKSRMFHVVVVLWAVYVVFLVFTQFTGVFYFIDDRNVYTRGAYYPVLLAPPVIIMLVNLYGLWQRRKKLSEKQRIAFVIYTGVPMLAMLIQMKFYGIYVIVLGTSIAALFMFTYILMDQTEQFYKQEAENVKLKADVLMAQSKPHFIYNSLVAIRSYLDEPEKAEEVLDHFAGFLRGSIDVLEETGCIRADREFETVKDYLYMEKERFGDDLTVVYEIEDSDFDLPPFSVQTLVENAVRHGIRESETGKGTVRIASYRTCTEHVVEVWDDGVGFAEEVRDGLPVGTGQRAVAEKSVGADQLYGEVQPDMGISTEKSKEKADRAHIGLSNLQKRLSLMCGGWLEIGDEKETVVRMRIPIRSDLVGSQSNRHKKENEDEYFDRG